MCRNTMAELKRKGDARILGLGETLRGHGFGQGLMPPHNCMADIPFVYPPKKIEKLSVFYVVYTLPTHFVRHALMIAHDANYEPVDLHHDSDFIRGALEPLAIMLGFNEDHDLWSGNEECVVVHFAEKLRYPPSVGVTVCR